MLVVVASHTFACEQTRFRSMGVPCYVEHLADLRIRVPINILDQPVGDITAEVNINYAEQLTGYRCQYGKITGLGQQVIGTYPFNCVSNFSLPLVGSAWGPSGFVSPCASESVPMTVDVTPA
jgi:hypothetical protein